MTAPKNHGQPGDRVAHLERVEAQLLNGLHHLQEISSAAPDLGERFEDMTRRLNKVRSDLFRLRQLGLW